MAIVIHHCKTLDSTNREAVRLAQRGAEPGTVIHADGQTDGKGRGKRQFVSPYGGLYFSLIVKPRLDGDKLALVTLAAGVGVCQEISSQTGVQIQLKWPNDLYVQGKKLGGILTETAPLSPGKPPEYIVIGIGVNVSTDINQFPPSLRGRVISLCHASVEPPLPTTESLLIPVVKRVQSMVKLLECDSASVLALWRRRDYLRNKTVEYVGLSSTVSATGVGLADNGQYIIRDNNGEEHSILAGDINPIRLQSESHGTG